MNSVKAFLKLIVALVLLAIAWLGVNILGQIIFVYTLLRILIFNIGSLPDRLEMFSEWVYNTAYSFDQTGNAIGEHMFNDFSLDGAWKFGNADHPISYVIAKQRQQQRLSKFWNFWAKVLVWVDFGARKEEGSDHLTKSIKNTENGL